VDRAGPMLLGRAWRENHGRPQASSMRNVDRARLEDPGVDARRAFPLDQLGSRLKCPRCGSRQVTVVFDVPNQPKAARR
jgi:hypothetical protein